LYLINIKYRILVKGEGFFMDNNQLIIICVAVIVGCCIIAGAVYFSSNLNTTPMNSTANNSTANSTTNASVSSSSNSSSSNNNVKTSDSEGYRDADGTYHDTGEINQGSYKEENGQSYYYDQNSHSYIDSDQYLSEYGSEGTGA
jgi:cytoskeletal protein RodZ